MRLATIVASALALVVASIDAVTVVAPSATHCFELPIVTLVPTKTPFPEKHCKQPPLPSENCLKAHIETDVHVIENKDVYGKPVLNCIGNASTSVYPSTSHFRGQSSLGFSKHQYSVKLHEAAPLLGFPEDRSFVLNGPVIDGSLIRNHLAQWLYRSTGRYSPRTRHIVLMVHDPVTNNLEYHGVYLALEQISYGPNRVGLAQLDNKCTVDQFNGGWAWQINPLNYGVYSPNIIFDQYELMFGAGERPVLMYPPKEDLTKSMRDYFVSTSTGPLPLLYRFLYDHADQPDKLEEYIDLGSFVDYMLHSELSQNSDAYRRSTYFFKDRDQPINAGPVWDFNLAFGTGNNQADWLFRIHFLWRRMLTNYKFVALTIKRWRTLRETVWKDESIVAFIDDAIAPLERQFVSCSKWHSEEMPCANVNKSGTFKSHVDRVKSAIQQRAKWMDENVVKFYGKIEKSQWAQATAGLPSYNCAVDGEDDGCLTNPDKYINNVTIPAIRRAYSGPVCNATNPTEQTSIDPCWLSFGVGSTIFCSGSGYCGQGPGATCACSNGRLPPTCALPATQSLDALDMISSNADKSSWLNDVVVLLTVGGVFGVLATFKRRRHRTAKFTTDERTPLANQLKFKSQPNDQAVHAYGTRF